MIELIGDIHGHADKLEKLLLKLGYKKSKGAYVHPNKKVLFVGDYIDRGPKIRESLEIVKAMVDSENAIALWEITNTTHFVFISKKLKADI